MNRLISIGEVRLAFRLIVKQPDPLRHHHPGPRDRHCLATMGFTFRDELVNSTLPYQAGERFARLYVLNRDGGRLDLDLERYHAFRDQAATFEHVGAVGGAAVHVAHGAGEVESIRGALITPRSMRWLDAARRSPAAR